MKSFIFGLLLGFVISTGIVWAEEFLELSPFKYSALAIDIDLLTQYDLAIRLNHAGETIRLEPIELWRRATLSKKQTSNEPKIKNCIDDGEYITYCADVYDNNELMKRK